VNEKKKTTLRVHDYIDDLLICRNYNCYMMYVLWWWLYSRERCLWFRV